MKDKHTKQMLRVAATLLLSGSLLFGGCANNVNPVNPQTPAQPAPPAGQTNPPNPTTPQTGDYTVTYNYGATGDVQLSANNLTLKVGQKLILLPAPSLTTNTRFTSSGENFFGDIMKQETSPQNSGQAVFTAIKAGKGKLQIIPNSTETDRAVDLWVTVQ